MKNHSDMLIFQSQACAGAASLKSQLVIGYSGRVPSQKAPAWRENMYNFGKKKNKKVLAAIVILIVVGMVLTTVLAALL